MRALGVALALFVAAPALAGEAPKPAPAKPARQKIELTGKKGPDKPIQIKADAFDAVEGGKRMTWKGHVLIVREDMKVECDALVGEGDDAKNLKRFTCRGNVHMRQPAVPDKHADREAWGEQAVFENETAILTVTGSPKGREGDNRFRGAVVYYDANADRLRGEKVEIEVVTPPDKDPLKPREPKK
jgi:lipopolysaccharide transport protein LptA